MRTSIMNMESTSMKRYRPIITVEQHILQEQKRFPGASGEFSWLLSGITLATKLIQAKIRRAGLELLPPGPSGGNELPTVVILRADRDASYGPVRRTLAEAQEQGFAQFSLVVLRREQP